MESDNKHQREFVG